MVIARSLALLLVVAPLSAVLSVQKARIADECAKTVGRQVYSNVFVHEETGDVLGYDLAVRRDGSSRVDALLYVYEGGNSDAGVPLSGSISNGRLSIQGTWVEHVIEYPSHKEIVQSHFVKLVGTLDPAIFRGELTMEGMGDREQVKLQHVRRIWSCKNWNPPSKK